MTGLLLLPSLWCGCPIMSTATATSLRLPWPCPLLNVAMSCHLKPCLICPACRLDVSMRVAPEALVNRQLRVYWEVDDAWFAGSVVAWDPKTARHQVRIHEGPCWCLVMGNRSSLCCIGSPEAVLVWPACVFKASI
jgi:hypothetical protein